MWQVEEGESEVDAGGVRQRATRTGVNTTHFVYNFSLSDFLAFGFCLPFSFWHSHFVAVAAFVVRFARSSCAICLFMSLFICLFLYLQS